MAEDQIPFSVVQKLKALDAFKDWSNYLLITTVGALGWTTASAAHAFSSPWIKDACVFLFAVSVVFAILTLGLIPHIGESIKEIDTSIYSVRWKGWFGGDYELMDFCFVQHVLFLLGILFYAGGTAFKTSWHSWVAIALALLAILFLLWMMLLCLWKRRRRGVLSR